MLEGGKDRAGRTEGRGLGREGTKSSTFNALHCQPIREQET